MSFTHLTTTERSESHKIRVTNTLSMSEIGHRLNRHKSTISRELSPNTDERHRVYLSRYGGGGDEDALQTSKGDIPECQS